MKFFIPFTTDPVQANRVYARIADRIKGLGYDIKLVRVYKIIFSRGDTLVSECVGDASDNGEIVLTIFKDHVGFFICTYSHGAVWGEPILARYSEVVKVELFDVPDTTPTYSTMETPDTLSQVMARLTAEGYTEDLNRHEDNALWNDPDAYRVDNVYRFEGPTNPDDESILYALSSDQYRVKGLLVNGYGLSADPVTAAVEERLKRWPVA